MVVLPLNVQASFPKCLPHFMKHFMIKYFKTLGCLIYHQSTLHNLSRNGHFLLTGHFRRKFLTYYILSPTFRRHKKYSLAFWDQRKCSNMFLVHVDSAFNFDRIMMTPSSRKHHMKIFQNIITWLLISG